MNKLELVKNDPWLEPYEQTINGRNRLIKDTENKLTLGKQSLSAFASGHLYFGLHSEDNEWVFREWAPNATSICLIGSFNNWKETEGFAFIALSDGVWELKLQHDKIKHQDLFKLRIKWKGGKGDRIPAWINRVVQDDKTMLFNAQVWIPETPYKWLNPEYKVSKNAPLIYEAHVGMATEEMKVGSYREFTQNVIPRIVKDGYNTIQLMAIQEHPYYGSFGYHVSNFFAASSRFGTPEDLKELIDTAHGHGIAVIMDIVHSHAVKNELEGLNNFDGTEYQYFHSGNRRNHPAWDSLCFNYSKPEVQHFLLSNCKFWLDEYHFDGFRFDGITSMLYLDHGLSRDFVNYQMYYDLNEDEDAIVYLALANKLIHELRPDAITVAEEMSGMPGTATPIVKGGLGFDYRLALGTPDYWIKIIKDVPDERWNITELFYELIKKRHDEKTIGYAESHDQALVGDKTIVFRLMDKEIYFHMDKGNKNLVVDRAMALHKMIRLITIATSGNGYLNFMGNEFGHPEWIDFPRAGNNWSYKYARRQWNLVDNPDLKYQFLNEFDQDMIKFISGDKILNDANVAMVHENNSAQVIAFQRSGFLFVFNFNPYSSFQDYSVQTEAGKYKICLNTDSLNFGGNGLVDESMTYFTEHHANKINHHSYMNIYIPSRSALVFRKLVSRSIYDLANND